MISFDIPGMRVPFEALLAVVLCLLLFRRALRERRQESKPPLSCLHPAALVGTCFGIGYFRPAPGTWGSLFGVLLLMEVAFLPRLGLLPTSWLLPLVVSLTLLWIALGSWAAQTYLRRTGREDPREIVIDEVAGLWTAASCIALMYAALLRIDAAAFRPLLMLSPVYLAVTFLLFRLLDIWKPWVIGRVDRRVQGGWGVMLDDVLAGIGAAVLFIIVFLAVYWSGGFLAFFSAFHPDWIGQPLPDRAY